MLSHGTIYFHLAVEHFNEAIGLTVLWGGSLALSQENIYRAVGWCRVIGGCPLDLQNMHIAPISSVLLLLPLLSPVL